MRPQIWEKDEAWISRVSPRVSPYLPELRENGIGVGASSWEGVLFPLSHPEARTGLVQRGAGGTARLRASVSPVVDDVSSFAQIWCCVGEALNPVARPRGDSTVVALRCKPMPSPESIGLRTFRHLVHRLGTAAG